MIEFPIFSPVVEFFDPSIKFRGIEISNLESRIDSGKDGSTLFVSGSLINQENYLRRVPSIIVVIEDEKRCNSSLKEISKVWIMIILIIKR